MERFLSGLSPEGETVQFRRQWWMDSCKPTPTYMRPRSFSLWPMAIPAQSFRGFPGGSDDRESSCHCERSRFHLWVGQIPWRKARQPTPVFLQENPMDRAAWRATVHGVTKSWTRLKWVSTHKVFKLASRYIAMSVEWVSKMLTCPERVRRMRPFPSLFFNFRGSDPPL